MSIRRGRLPPGLVSVFFAAVSATPPILPRPTDTQTRPPPTARKGQAPPPLPAGPANTVVTGACEDRRRTSHVCAKERVRWPRSRPRAIRFRRVLRAPKPPKGDPVQDAPQVTKPKHAAAGLPAIGHTLRIAQRQMGVKRTALTLLRVNQKDGFDCPGCAWPDPDHRHAAEFCENGAKA